MVPEQFCPACLAKVNRAGDPGHGRAPRVGDLNVCIHCAAVSRWAEGFVLCLLSPIELAGLAVFDPEAWRDVQRFQAAIRRIPPDISTDTKTRH